MKRVLVTGAGGFIGAVVTRKLLQQKNVIAGAVVRRTTDLWRLVNLQPELIHADVLDYPQTLEAVRNFRPDAIVHCAMFSGHPADAVSRNACFRISVLGTLHVMEAARELNSSLILMGSSLIYAPSEISLTEEARIDPASARGVAKTATLVSFRQLSRLWGMHSCELRIFSAYGPWQQPGRFIPKLLQAAGTGEAVSVRPGPRHDYVHAEDIADACLSALDKIHTMEPAEAFNIGSGVERTNEETVAAVEEVTGRKIRIAADTYAGAHPSDTAHWRADIAKAARILQWQPKISFTDGLRGMTAWQQGRRN